MSKYGDMFKNAAPAVAMPGITPGAIIPEANLAVVNTNSNGITLNNTGIALVTSKPRLPADLLQKGTASANKLNEISEQVLSRIKVADAGEFGKGVTDILALTESVDMSKLDDDNKGFFGKALGLFKQTRVKLLAQFDDVNTQVGRIATNLEKEISDMGVEQKWLSSMYDANIASVQQLQLDINEVAAALELQKAYVQELQAMPNRTMQQDEQLMNEHQEQEKIERHLDRLERQLQIGIMDAPDIRSLEKNNYDAAQDFGDLISVTLPMWKRQLTMTLTAARQVKRAEMGNAIKDRNNELIRKRADTMHQAGVKTAQLSNRSSVADVDTLEYAQNKLVERITTVRQIEATARVQRENDIKRLRDNREKLKQEMLKW